MKRFKIFLLTVTILFSLSLAACGPSPEEIALMTSTANTAIALSWTPTFTSTPLPTHTPTPTPTPTITSSPTPTPTPEPLCIPGETIFDAEGDVELAHIDLLKVETLLEDRQLTVTFYVKDIPDEITINREEMEKGYGEYEWAVHINSDNDATTGRRGYEYELKLFSFKSGAARTGSFEEVFKNGVMIWESTAEGRSTTISNGKLTVDMQAKSITIVGTIPKISPDSHLTFQAFDYNPLGSINRDLICE